MDARAVLYPPIEPYDCGLLPLDLVHTMYWEVSGNPLGIPVLFLHGGPGGGCVPEHRRFFDPEVFRIVLFDQRGAGQSLPAAETLANNTAQLVRDIETLRNYLGVRRWLVFGGSWGATLALAYGQTHPARCLGFVLRGVFLGRATEVNWFLYGMSRVFPEAWARFAGHVPEAERGDLLRAYLKRLFDPDPAVHLPAARAWIEYEASCSTLLPNPELVAGAAPDALPLARIEAHYFAHQCFLAPDQLIGNLYRVRHLRAAIVQGRYDMICPPSSADELARAWPGARYVVVPDAGHSVWDSSLRCAVVREVERFKTLLA